MSAAFSNAEAPSSTTLDEPTDTATTLDEPTDTATTLDEPTATATTLDEPTDTATGAWDSPTVAQPDGDSTREPAAMTFVAASDQFGGTGAMADKAPKTSKGSLFQKAEPKEPGHEREDSHDAARLVRILASLCLAAGLLLGAYTMFSSSDPTVVIPATPPVGHPQNPSATPTTLASPDGGLDFSDGSDFSTGQDFSVPAS